jgi:hypothetical protein
LTRGRRCLLDSLKSSLVSLEPYSFSSFSKSPIIPKKTSALYQNIQKSNLYSNKSVLDCNEASSFNTASCSESGDFEQVTSWVGLLGGDFHTSGGDKHRVVSFSSESHRGDLGNWHGDFSHDLAGCSVDLKDAAASEHGDVNVAFSVDGQTIWHVGLGGSEGGEVTEGLFTGDGSSLVVIAELLDGQVVRIDEVHGVGLVVEGDSIRESDLGLDFSQTFSHGESVQGSNALGHVKDGTSLFRDHGADVEATTRVNLAVVETNTVGWEFSQDADNLSHGGSSIPGDEQQATASTNDELVGGSLDWEDERDVGLSKDSGSVSAVGGGVHAEDLSSHDIDPVEALGGAIIVRRFTNE